MGAFAILASVLAVMGLFGVAMISIARKRKEIGLRKVNGASILEVTYLINKDFVRWVIAAICHWLASVILSYDDMAKTIRL